jgi:hypothetical protein
MLTKKTVMENVTSDMHAKARRLSALVLAMAVFLGCGSIAPSVAEAPTGTAIVPSFTAGPIPAQEYNAKNGFKLTESELAVRAGNLLLKENTDYKVTYNKKSKPGLASVGITGIGAYAGNEMQAYFDVVPPKVTKVSAVSLGKRSMIIAWKMIDENMKKSTKDMIVTKYVAYYRIKGADTWKSKVVSGKETVAHIKKLKRGKKYQVKVVAYRSVQTDGVTKKYESPESKIVTSNKKIK